MLGGAQQRMLGWDKWPDSKTQEVKLMRPGE